MKYVCNLCGWVYDEEEAGGKIFPMILPASSAARARMNSLPKSKDHGVSRLPGQQNKSMKSGPKGPLSACMGDSGML